MFNVKVLLLAFLLLATNVLAVRVTYVAKFTGQLVTDRTSKLATVDDHKGEQIIEKMATWSNGKYKAARSGSAAVNMINVVNVVEAPTKGVATDMVQEMQHIVATNYRPKSRSPSPHKVRRSPRPARRLKARSPRLARQY